jgi:ABC-type dipeptide/oligopeptide/nickel transport system permease subunit
MLTRIIHGGRISLTVGLVVIFFATSVGTILGLISGYYGGRIDAVIQRIVDTLLSFPYLILATALVAVLGPGLQNMLVALAYKEWIYPCRVVRSEVLAAKNKEYVEAAKAAGAGDLHIMFREILPNVFGSVIVVATLRVAWVILMEASLSFLGLGVEPPAPAWGTIISEGRRFINTQWWISTFPGIAVLLTALGINLIGEGLRDALDPRMR